MSIQWTDVSTSNKGGGFILAVGDLVEWNDVRRGYVSSLVARLIGLTAQQVDDVLESLDEGYCVYRCTANGAERSFRVSRSGYRGWDGVSFTLTEEGTVQRAHVY